MTERGSYGDWKSKPKRLLMVEEVVGKVMMPFHCNIDGYENKAIEVGDGKRYVVEGENVRISMSMKDGGREEQGFVNMG